jgi:hypothetical protein
MDDAGETNVQALKLLAGSIVRDDGPALGDLRSRRAE